MAPKVAEESEALVKDFPTYNQWIELYRLKGQPVVTIHIDDIDLEQYTKVRGLKEEGVIILQWVFCR
jgi:hypothetical protein